MTELTEARVRDIARKAAQETVNQAFSKAKEAAVVAAREAAVSAAKEAVTQTLTLIGLDIKDPVKLQTDFATLRTMLRDDERMEDDIFLRQLRRRMQSFSNKVGFVIIAIVLGALATVLGLGARAWLGVFPPPH